LQNYINNNIKSITFATNIELLFTSPQSIDKNTADFRKPFGNSQSSNGQNQISIRFNHGLNPIEL